MMDHQHMEEELVEFAKVRNLTYHKINDANLLEAIHKLFIGGYSVDDIIENLTIFLRTRSLIYA